MSKHDWARAERFNVAAVTRAAGVPAVEDELGRLRFKWDGAELLVAPSGPEASCRVALLDNTGQLVYREYSLRTDAAGRLATLLRILARERADHALDPRARADRIERCCEIIARLDERNGYERARQVAEDLDPAAEPGPGTDLADRLHPGAVRERFPLARVAELGRGMHRRVRVSWLDAVFTLMREPTDDRVSVLIGTHKGEELFEAANDSVLCLLALQEIYTLVGEAIYDTEIEMERLISMRSDLEELRRYIIAGRVEARDAYLRLIELCDPDGDHGTSENTPTGQLVAIATMAALQWIARRGGAPLDRRIDLEVVAAAIGRELNPLDDEHVLPFRCGMLAFRNRDYVAIGRGILVTGAQSLLSRQTALAMPTLDWMPRGMWKLDTLGHESQAELRKDLLRAVKEPWRVAG